MADDFSALEQMAYSGRGIAVGMTPNGDIFVGYTLTGRQPSSRARDLVPGEKTDVIRTNPTDPKELEKGSPALLIYPAIIPVKSGFVASNGAQTNLVHSAAYFNSGFDVKDSHGLAGTLIDSFRAPFLMYDAHEDRFIDLTSYEPDTHKTPRITAIVNQNGWALHIVACRDNRKYTDLFQGTSEPGWAEMITTYKGDNESPLLLPFSGRPLVAKITSVTAEDIAESMYKAIRGKGDDNFRVAAAVYTMNKDGKTSRFIINRSERGE